MKFDTTVKELQKEKTDLEAKLKQVNTALAALTKLGGKQAAPASEQTSAPATSVSQTHPATTVKPAVTPTQPSHKPFGS